MIPEGVDRLYISEMTDRIKHLAYFVAPVLPGEDSHAVLVCDLTPVIKKTLCRADGSGLGYYPDEEELDRHDQHHNEVTCEKCLAIARGE